MKLERWCWSGGAAAWSTDSDPYGLVHRLCSNRRPSCVSGPITASSPLYGIKSAASAGSRLYLRGSGAAGGASAATTFGAVPSLTS